MPVEIDRKPDEEYYKAEDKPVSPIPDMESSKLQQQKQDPFILADFGGSNAYKKKP